MIDKECEFCNGIGYEAINIDGEIQFVECRCTKMKLSDRYRLHSSISMGLKYMTFDSFITGDVEVLTNAKNKALDYVRDFDNKVGWRNNFILFHGQPGSGKTHLGIAISNALLDKGYEVVYMPYRNSITEIKQNITNYDVYRKLMARYSGCGVLYIDDFLKGKVTEADVNVIYEIINYRYNNNLPIIMSTEKSLEEMLDFDEAIGSRIIEMCKESIIRFDGFKLNYRIYGGIQHIG